MNEYTGTDRRQTVNNGIRRLTDKVIKNWEQLKIINGRVTEVEGRVLTIENNELLEEGFRKGKKSMRASTRNMLIVVIMALVCLFTGISVFTSSQGSLEKVIKTTLLEMGTK